ncbi:NACHT, LRR and PYD domains-containing protein 3-like [Astyanax mexicanus]|uniref:NACHT, LRR and PYD domains-containing protein 3-like n=1 Tax=Astyanax mexicanus TaxID=7994 RepID=A0A8T2L7H5_ASTMX|nr:NACHT, LRR and PYD domains-containing protein 3-like [Astyanax mexicanus]
MGPRRKRTQSAGDKVTPGTRHVRVKRKASLPPTCDSTKKPRSMKEHSPVSSGGGSSELRYIARHCKLRL